jgi:hypothetical protein
MLLVEVLYLIRVKVTLLLVIGNLINMLLDC